MRIELQNVHKRYGDVEVVSALTLSLPSGQVTALLGPSGCGKTTTLRMIAGLERASAGRVTIGDRLVDDGAGVFVPPEQRGLGMVFQSYALWPHKSVRENVAYPLTLQQKPKNVVDAATTKALESVRLLALADRGPHQLSGGQQQRVAVARALVGDGEKAPPVLLLDEPLANLDAKLREEMRAELALIAKTSGATVVAVTHDQQEAFSLADHVVVLDKGRLAQQGTPEDLYLRPATPFVGGFTGPMAFLPRAVVGAVVSAVVGAGAGAVVVGDGALLGVRPEWWTLGEDAPAGPRVDVVVVQRLFLGREFELLVETRAGGHRLTLRVPSTSTPPAPGSALRLGLTRACAFAG